MCYNPGMSSFIPAAHFHQLTPLYESLVSPFLSRIWENVTSYISDHAASNAQVVDVGCGPGTVLAQLHSTRADLHLTGTDVDDAILALARDSLPLDIQLVRASATLLPFSDHSIDVVNSTFVFHHLNSEEKLLTMEEVKRVLKPNGFFLLADFSRDGEPTWANLLSLFEPEIAPQLDGELLRIAESAGASSQILSSFYGAIRLQLIQFPEAA